MTSKELKQENQRLINKVNNFIEELESDKEYYQELLDQLSAISWEKRKLTQKQELDKAILENLFNILDNLIDNITSVDLSISEELK